MPEKNQYPNAFDKTVGSPYLIANEVVTYSSTDNQGKKISLSGLLVYPFKFSGKINAPILSFNHATQILSLIHI